MCRTGIRALRRPFVVRVLEADGQPPIIFDLGTGLRPYGADAATGEFHGTALLSHLHWDHVQGLPFFTPLHREGATLDIYGPRQAEGPLGEVFAQMMRPPFFPITPDRPRGRRPLPRHRRRRLPGRARQGAVALGAPRRPDARVPRRLERRLGRVPPRSRAGLRSRATPTTTSRPRCSSSATASTCSSTTRSTRPRSTSRSGTGVTARSTTRCTSRAKSGARNLVLFHHDPAHGDDDLDRIGRDARRPRGAHGRARAHRRP